MKNLILGVSALLLLSGGLRAQELAMSNASTPQSPIPPSAPEKIETLAFSSKKAQRYKDSEDPSRTKTFSKSFVIDKNDKINISNVYGSLTIKTWDKNEIKYDATITAFGNTDSDAQELLDLTTISSNKSGDQVSFKTSISNGSNGNFGNGTRNGRRWRREVKVHATIYLPASVALTASQTYGGIAIDNFTGPTSLKVQYGSISGGDLSNSNNYISAQYSSVKFTNVNQATISQQYGSGLTINQINTIDLNAQYSAVNINTIKTTGKLSLQYGKGVSLGSAGDLTINAQYSPVTISQLEGNLISRNQYGRLSVEKVESGVKNIAVDGQYSQIRLGFSPSFSADLDVYVSYGQFISGAGINANKISSERTTSRYNGTIGRGGSSRVSVKSTYNSVHFN